MPYSAIPLERFSWLRRWYLPLMLLLLVRPMWLHHQQWPQAAIWSDAEGYYLYLPALFNLPSLHEVPVSSMIASHNEWGANTTKYSCGVAFFELPMFLVARTVAYASGVDRRDIYHPYYSWGVAATAFWVAALGLWLLQRSLRRRGFAEWVVALTLVGVLFGTNLYHYVVRESGTSHVYSFTLMTALTLAVPALYARPTLRRALVVGGLVGWLVLIRPTALLVLPFVVLYDVYSWAELTSRIRFWLTRWPLAVAAGAIAALCYVPQLLYWHEMYGQWFYYSYTSEGFPNWASPKILEVLFDTRNGLFTFSPLVLVMVAGLALSWRDRRTQAPSLTLIFVCITYAFASWWMWWFGGSLGQRSYIDYYGLLAFPLAFVLERVLSWRGAGRVVGLAVLAFLTYYSLRMDFLYQMRYVAWDSPDWVWNFTYLRNLWANLF